MRRALIPATLAILAAQVAAQAGWEVVTVTDRLDAKAKSVTAATQAKATFQQSGRAVQAGVVIVCGLDLLTKAPKAFVVLRFSELVAIGERRVRWRVDEHPIHQRKNRFYDDGTAFFLDLAGDFAPILAELRTGKLLKIDADLPFAGNPVLEFDVADAPAAFAKLPCLAGRDRASPK